jgi:hypothetical protein
MLNMNNRVSASLGAQERQEILQAIALIKDKLPFLLSLTTEERKAMPKMGDRNMPFVKKALEAATQNPDFLPRAFEVEELRKDIELFEALYPLVIAFSQLQDALHDTYITVGSEAYSASLKIYNYAKVNVDMAGVQRWVDEMGERFARANKKVPADSVSA